MKKDWFWIFIFITIMVMIFVGFAVFDNIALSLVFGIGVGSVFGWLFTYKKHKV